MESRRTRWALGAWVALVILFLWIPLALIMVYAFNKSNVQSWPITGFTTHWFGVAWRSGEVRDAIWLSVRAGLRRTACVGPLVRRGWRDVLDGRGAEQAAAADPLLHSTRPAAPGRQRGRVRDHPLHGDPSGAGPAADARHWCATTYGSSNDG